MHYATSAFRLQPAPNETTYHSQLFNVQPPVYSDTSPELTHHLWLIAGGGGAFAEAKQGGGYLHFFHFTVRSLPHSPTVPYFLTDSIHSHSPTSSLSASDLKIPSTPRVGGQDGTERKGDSYERGYSLSRLFHTGYMLVPKPAQTPPSPASFHGTFPSSLISRSSFHTDSDPSHSPLGVRARFSPGRASCSQHDAACMIIG